MQLAILIHGYYVCACIYRTPLFDPKTVLLQITRSQRRRGVGARAGREPTAPRAPPDDLTHPGHPAVRRGEPRGAKSKEHGSPRAPFRPPGVFGVLATTTTRSCARFRYFIIPRPGRGRGQPATARSGAALAQLGFLERRAAPRRVVREQTNFCDNLRVARRTL